MDLPQRRLRRFGHDAFSAHFQFYAAIALPYGGGGASSKATSGMERNGLAQHPFYWPVFSDGDFDHDPL